MDLKQQGINVGYRALAAKPHPDVGGSPEAMARLNQVRDRLDRVSGSFERKARRKGLTRSGKIGKNLGKIEERTPLSKPAGEMETGATG